MEHLTALAVMVSESGLDFVGEQHSDLIAGPLLHELHPESCSRWMITQMGYLG